MAKKDDLDALDAVSEPQAEPAPAPRPTAAQPAPYVHDGSVWGIYEVTLTEAASRKGVVHLSVPTPGADAHYVFSRPDQTTKTLRTSKAAAADLEAKGWKVKKP